jgi:hypothetical protein
VLAFVGNALIAAAAGAAISYLVMALTPRPKPPGVSQDRGDESSGTYAWDGIQTNYGQGFPVAWGYGRHTIGGQGIYSDVHVTESGGTVDDRLRLVIALVEGPIRAVGDVVADELDALGSTDANGAPVGPPIPDHIRVNDNLVQSPTGTGTVVRRLLVGPFAWNGINSAGFPDAPIPRVGDTLEIETLPNFVPIGTVQITKMRTSHDLDVLLLSGMLPTGVAGQNGIPAANQWLLVKHVWTPGIAWDQNTVVSSLDEVRFSVSPGVRAWIRPGTLDQSALPLPFAGASAVFSPASQLNEVDDEQIFTYTASEQVSAIGFVFAFPGGLYAQDPHGNQLGYPVQLDLWWRPVASEAWRSFFTTLGAPMPSRTIGSAARISPLLDAFTARLTPNAEGVRGPLEVRVARRSPSGGTNVISQCVWRNATVHTPHTFSYPRLALLGLELVAGARFSGGLPNIRVRCDLALVRVWDSFEGFSPRTWEVPAAPFDFHDHAPGRNPAWILGDFLTSPWGLGNYVRDAQIDWQSIRNWADFCDADPSPSDPWGEPAFRCDLIGDRPRPAWDWVLAICAAGRAAPVRRNGKIGVVYQYRDAHGSVPAKEPTQLITSSNCEDIKVEWFPRGNRPTVYLWQFLDEDEQHAQSVYPVEDFEGTLNDPEAMQRDEWRPESVQAYGVTRKSQLFRDGTFLHRVNRKIKRGLQFTAGPWTLAAEVGDLVDFEHEMLKPFGADQPISGVVLEGADGGDVITVDHVVTIPADTDIVVRDPDGKPQRRRIIDVAPAAPIGTVLTLDDVLTVNNGAACVVGLVDKLVQTYEIIAIGLRKDLKRRVRAVQWVPEIHDEITPDLWDEEGNSTGEFLRQPPLEGAPLVENLRVITERDGRHRVAFSRPAQLVGRVARVFVFDELLAVWILAGSTQGDEVVWPQFVPLRPYRVSVVVEGLAGDQAPPEDGAQLEFVADEFPPFSPPSVTNVRAQELDGKVLYQWDELGQLDHLYYELRLGTCWASAEVLWRGEAPRALLLDPPASGTVLVAARSRSGLYGQPVAVAAPAWAPPNTVPVVDDDDLDPSPAGTHSSTEFTSGRIQLVAGALSGTYTSIEHDVGYQAPIFWQVVVDRAEIEDATVDDLQFPLDGGEAMWRTVNTRPASPARAGIDWQTRVDDLAQPMDSLKATLLVQGHVGETGTHTRVFVESRFFVDGAWTAYREHRDRTVVAQKFQVRLSLNRESARYHARVTALKYAGAL